MSDFTNDIAEVINTVADKVKEYGGYAKIQALIKAEEAKKHEQYYRLGKKYYELYKDAPASDLTEITNKIVACDEKIAAYKEELKASGEETEEESCDCECEDVDVEDIAAAVEEEETTEE